MSREGTDEDNEVRFVFMENFIILLHTLRFSDSLVQNSSVPYLNTSKPEEQPRSRLQAQAASAWWLAADGASLGEAAAANRVYVLLLSYVFHLQLEIAPYAALPFLAA